MSEAINAGLVNNPTLTCLASMVGPSPRTYGEVVVAHAQPLEAVASDGVHDPGIATDFARDDYARLSTAASMELRGVAAPLIRIVVVDSQAERTADASVVQCIKGSGAAAARQAHRAPPGGPTCRRSTGWSSPTSNDSR